MISSIGRRSAALAGLGCALLAGCGTQAYPPATSNQAANQSAGQTAGPAATTSQAQSQQALEAERSAVAARYWPATSIVMKAVPGIERQQKIRLRFEEAQGTFASCDDKAATGLQYQIAVVLEASGPEDEDLGWPLGQAARVAERDLTSAGWGPFTVSQGVWVAAARDGVIATFDNDPSATETDTSMATALVYFLEGACVPVPGTSVTPPGGGSQAGGGPDAGPPPGDASAGDGLPPVRDTYGLGPAPAQS